MFSQRLKVWRPKLEAAGAAVTEVCYSSEILLTLFTAVQLLYISMPEIVFTSTSRTRVMFTWRRSWLYTPYVDKGLPLFHVYSLMVLAGTPCLEPGAVISPPLAPAAQDACDPRITHIVVGSANSAAAAPAAGAGQHRVGEDWLQGCLAQSRRLPEANHAAAEPASPEASAGER